MYSNWNKFLLFVPICVGVSIVACMDPRQKQYDEKRPFDFNDLVYGIKDIGTNLFEKAFGNKDKPNQPPPYAQHPYAQHPYAQYPSDQHQPHHYHDQYELKPNEVYEKKLKNDPPDYGRRPELTENQRGYNDINNEKNNLEGHPNKGNDFDEGEDEKYAELDRNQAQINWSKILKYGSAGGVAFLVVGLVLYKVLNKDTSLAESGQVVATESNLNSGSLTPSSNILSSELVYFLLCFVIFIACVVGYLYRRKLNQTQFNLDKLPSDSSSQPQPQQQTGDSDSNLNLSPKSNTGIQSHISGDNSPTSSKIQSGIENQPPTNPANPWKIPENRLARAPSKLLGVSNIGQQQQKEYPLLDKYSLFTNKVGLPRVGSNLIQINSQNSPKSNFILETPSIAENNKNNPNNPMTKSTINNLIIERIKDHIQLGLVDKSTKPVKNAVKSAVNNAAKSAVNNAAKSAVNNAAKSAVKSAVIASMISNSNSDVPIRIMPTNPLKRSQIELSDQIKKTKNKPNVPIVSQIPDDSKNQSTIESNKNQAKIPIKDSPKNPIKDPQKNPPKNPPKSPIKNLPKNPPKNPTKEPTKNQQTKGTVPTKSAFRRQIIYNLLSNIEKLKLNDHIK